MVEVVLDLSDVSCSSFSKYCANGSSFSKYRPVRAEVDPKYGESRLQGHYSVLEDTVACHEAMIIKHTDPSCTQASYSRIAVWGDDI